MRAVTIVNRTRDSVLGSSVRVADRWWLRARGFLRRPAPRQGEGLLLNPCRAVHMVGMSFALDVLFVDRHGRVLALYPELAPGRRSAWHGPAKYALEVPAGTIAATGTQVGDLIAWSPAEGGRANHGPAQSATTVEPEIANAPEAPSGVAALDATEMSRGTR